MKRPKVPLRGHVEPMHVNMILKYTYITNMPCMHAGTNMNVFQRHAVEPEGMTPPQEESFTIDRVFINL